MKPEKREVILPKLSYFNTKINELIDERISKSVIDLLESIAAGENYDLDYLIDTYATKYVKSTIKYSISPTTLKAIDEL